ncbi:hypothetical protein POM88_004842 [Heracleum sosnowskyi]|uniref:Lipoyl synthase n=1 Tax=Heracleum sosnowskyi TaxID=360622 RepID=A0AAD8JMH4_9APIA|nr:hypothetical protein POM88_004842 [Heracleum sosnowskyi]
MEKVRAAGVDVITFGQYMRPSKCHIPVFEYTTPEAFEKYRILGMEMLSGMEANTTKQKAFTVIRINISFSSRKRRDSVRQMRMRQGGVALDCGSDCGVGGASDGGVMIVVVARSGNNEGEERGVIWTTSCRSQLTQDRIVALKIKEFRNTYCADMPRDFYLVFNGVGPSYHTTCGTSSLENHKRPWVQVVTPPMAHHLWRITRDRLVIIEMKDESNMVQVVTPPVAHHLWRTTRDRLVIIEMKDESNRESGIIFALKLYPAGATTNSQDGVTDLFGKCSPVLEEMMEQNMPLLRKCRLLRGMV